MKYKLWFSSTILLFCGCATTTFVGKTDNNPYKVENVKESSTIQFSNYSVNRPILTITVRRGLTTKYYYQSTERYHKEVSGSANTIAGIVDGTALLLAIFSKNSSVRIGGLVVLGAGVVYGFANKRSNFEKVVENTRLVDSDSSAKYTKIRITLQDNSAIDATTNMSGCYEVDLSKYIDRASDLRVSVSVISSGASNDITIPASFFAQLSAKAAQDEELRKIAAQNEERRKQQEAQQARIKVIEIEAIAKRKFPLKGINRLSNKGAMWYQIELENASKSVGLDMYDRVNAISDRLDKTITAQVYAISLVSCGSLIFYRNMSESYFATYYQNQAFNLLKAFNNDADRCKQMLTRPTIEESIRDMMRERVYAEKENRLDAFRYGIENSLGIGLRRDLDYSSPND